MKTGAPRHQGLCCPLPSPILSVRQQRLVVGGSGNFLWREVAENGGERGNESRERIISEPLVSGSHPPLQRASGDVHLNSHTCGHHLLVPTSRAGGWSSVGLSPSPNPPFHALGKTPLHPPPPAHTPDPAR